MCFHTASRRPIDSGLIVELEPLSEAENVALFHFLFWKYSQMLVGELILASLTRNIGIAFEIFSNIARSLACTDEIKVFELTGSNIHRDTLNALYKSLFDTQHAASSVNSLVSLKANKVTFLFPTSVWSWEAAAKWPRKPEHLVLLKFPLLSILKCPISAIVVALF